MPLNNIALPYSCWNIFGILIQVATFDFLPVTDLYEFGFTETEPWSQNFDWLSYGSVNFIDSMGSITVFALILCIQGLLVLFITCLGPRMFCSRFNWFNTLSYKQSALTFVYEAMFELVICISISMQMLKIHEIWNTVDKVSVAL